MSDAIGMRVEAERCFQLTRVPASTRLADELEALGRAFEQEVREAEARLLHQSVQTNRNLGPTLRREKSDC
jgi:hypothetical protein